MQLSPSRTIVHLSDTHIQPDVDDLLHGGVKSFDNLSSIVDLVVESGVKPDVVVITGDLTDKGETPAYVRLRELLAEAESRIGAPIIVALGNHDKRPGFYEGFLEQEASDAPYYYTQMVGGLRFCVLDSSVPGAPHGELGDEQLAWLSAELSTPAPEGTFILLHHPPVQGPVPVINLLMLRDAEALEEVVSESEGVLAVLAGHVHHPTSALFANTMCFAAPASAYTVDPLAHENGFRGVEGAAFGLIHVYEDRVVGSAVSLPTNRAELYRHDLSIEQMERWAGNVMAGAKA